MLLAEGMGGSQSASKNKKSSKIRLFYRQTHIRGTIPSTKLSSCPPWGHSKLASAGVPRLPPHPQPRKPLKCPRKFGRAAQVQRQICTHRNALPNIPARDTS